MSSGLNLKLEISYQIRLFPAPELDILTHSRPSSLATISGQHNLLGGEGIGQQSGKPTP
jgi:hypothetical protein